MKIRFKLNGKAVEREVDLRQTLLEFLRRNEIYSVKYGCDHGECGACTVLVDGKAQNSCLMLIHTVEGREVETLESLNNNYADLHPLQKRFLETGAVQCGYCTPGMIMAAEALVRGKPGFDEQDIRDALAGNLCRCTGYVKPVEAIER